MRDARPRRLVATATGGGSPVRRPECGRAAARPKRVKTRRTAGRGHGATPTATVRQQPRLHGEVDRRSQAQPPTSSHGPEQRRGRRGGGDHGGHQDDAGQERRLDDVGTTDGARADAGGAQPGDLGPASPELAGEPGHEVGEGDQGDPERHEQREAVGTGRGVAASGSATRGVRRGLRRRRRLGSWASTAAGVSARATTTDRAPRPCRRHSAGPPQVEEAAGTARNGTASDRRRRRGRLARCRRCRPRWRAV